MELQGSKKRATFADTFSACNSYQEWSIAFPGFGPYIGSGNNCCQTPVLGLGLGVDLTFSNPKSFENQFFLHCCNPTLTEYIFPLRSMGTII